MKRGAELALDIERSDDPLPEIRRALRSRFRGAGIVTVGLGMRRHERRRGRPLTPEPAIKILVRKKLDPLPRGIERLPSWLVLRSRWLGRPMRVRIRTDVESMPRAVPTRYQIGAAAGGSLCTAAYARWTAGGVQRYGFVTAGHGLWQNPGAAAPVGSAPVKVTDQRILSCRVVCASHLKRDGLDVALLELPSLDPALESMWSGEIGVPSIGRLLDCLGAGIDDGLSLPADFQHFVLLPQELRAVALYREYPIQVGGGWGSCKLADVVECAGLADTFIGGTSGSGLVSETARLALAIQSLCIDAGDLLGGHNTRGVGTSFLRAVRWIRDTTGRDVELFWRMPPP